MACVDQHGGIGPQKLEATGRGALNDGGEEGLAIEGPTEVLLTEGHRTGDVTGLVRGLECRELEIRGSGGDDVELEMAYIYNRRILDADLYAMDPLRASQLVYIYGGQAA